MQNAHQSCGKKDSTIKVRVNGQSTPGKTLSNLLAVQMQYKHVHSSLHVPNDCVTIEMVIIAGRLI